ncbi:hypothetical protein [Paenibacillus macerans]|uniref:hypothetical protein n=1 Tax=Paenibacillus macerans TaxID=44252 RepID=UPI00203E29B2|nr:hypothetical protein [Paenibacillus macerans]MCM3701878.1 hypothetical protein [Paenibacillus macerans]
MLSLADKIYIAKYFEHDGSPSLGAAMGVTQQCIISCVKRMKKNGEWELYRSLSDEEYEKIVEATERRVKQNAL